MGWRAHAIQPHSLATRDVTWCDTVGAQEEAVYLLFNHIKACGIALSGVQVGPLPSAFLPLILVTPLFTPCRVCLFLPACLSSSASK